MISISKSLSKLFLIITFISLLSGNMAMAQKAYWDRMINKPKSYPIKTAFCTKTEQSPKIDGKLDDSCWKNAAILDDFQTTNGKKAAPAKYKTTAQIVYDDQYLYIGIYCEEPDIEGISEKAFLPDDYNNILRDDRIEVYIDPAHDHQNVLNYVVNPSGATLDQKIYRGIQYSKSSNTDLTWNSKWVAKVHKGDNFYSVEYAIDISRIREKQISKGTTFGFNICRARTERGKEINWGPGNTEVRNLQQLSAWKYVHDQIIGSVNTWHEPIMYGDLIFGEQPVKVDKINFHEASMTYSGEEWYKPQLWGINTLEIEIENISKKDQQLELEVETIGFGGKPLKNVKSVILQTGSKKMFNIDFFIQKDYDNSFNLTIKDDKQEMVYETTYTTRVPPFIEFNLEQVYNPKVKDKTIQYTMVTQPDAFKNLKLELALYSATDNDLIAKEIVSDPDPAKDFNDCFKEVNIGSLSDKNLYIKSTLISNKGDVVAQFSQPFTIKSYGKDRTFKAYDGIYDYGGIPGKAVIIQFEDNKDFVFWEHASYVPWWDIHSLCYSYEFHESWGFGNQGCNEPMQDKINKYSEVSIVESTPARVVVHWSYALNSPNYKIFMNEWVDEYYYFYPDGTGIREVLLWANTDVSHDYSQVILTYPPGVTPMQMFEDDVATGLNLAGNKATNADYRKFDSNTRPDNYHNWNEEIFRMLFKDRPDPYFIWSKDKNITPYYYTDQNLTGFITSELGAHWPVTKRNIDVYGVVGTDKPYHGWLGNIHIKSDKNNVPNKNIQFMGVTDEKDESLIQIGKSWLNPIGVKIESYNGNFVKYDPSQRAYIFDQINGKLVFQFEKRNNEKIINPVLIIKGAVNEDYEILVNGKKTNKARMGITSYQNTQALVAWIGESINSGGRVELTPKR